MALQQFVVASQRSTFAGQKVTPEEIQAAQLYMEEKLGSDLYSQLMGATVRKPFTVETEGNDLAYQIRIFVAENAFGHNFDIIPVEAKHAPFVIGKGGPTYLRSAKQSEAIMSMALMEHRRTWRHPITDEFDFLNISNPREITGWHIRRRADIFALGTGDAMLALRERDLLSHEWNADRPERTTYWQPMIAGPRGLVDGGQHPGDKEMAQAMHAFLSKLHTQGNGLRTFVPWYIALDANEKVKNSRNSGNPFFYLTDVAVPGLLKDWENAVSEYDEMLPGLQRREWVTDVARKQAGGIEVGPAQDFPDGDYIIRWTPGQDKGATKISLQLGAPNFKFNLAYLRRGQQAGAEIVSLTLATITPDELD